MSCEGPVLPVCTLPQHPAAPPVPRLPTAMAVNPHIRRLALSQIQGRNRSSSASDQLLQVPDNITLPPSSPLSSPESSLPVDLSSRSSDYLRSSTLPRNARGSSAEPTPFSQSLSPDRQLRAAISPRFIRRTATVDTNMISKEEFDDFTQFNQYKVVEIIGSGAYGIVHKATTDENKNYAMKIVAKSRLRRKSFPLRPRPKPKLGNLPKAQNIGGLSASSGAGGLTFQIKSPLDNVHREIAILKKLDHPNVVKLVEVLDDPREDELIMVFEYLQKGSVMKEIPTSETLSEDQAREYFIDLILGLEYLHKQHIIHRDIKPDNLLLDEDGHIKIADFGVSEEIDTSDTHLTRTAGTPAFTSPECLDVTKKTYRGQGVDIWAAGVTLYCFIYGNVPFFAKSITDLYDVICNDSVQFPPSREISPDLKDLLLQLLEKNPMKRITIDEIRRHRWFCDTARTIPSREENCQEVMVNQQEIATAFRTFRTPIHILVMIKQMAKKRSFSNPYSPKSTPRSSPRASPNSSPSNSPTSPNPPSSPATKRNILRKSHLTPAICIDSAESDSFSAVH